MKRIFSYLLTFLLLLFIVPINDIQADEISPWANLNYTLNAYDNYIENDFFEVRDNNGIRTIKLLKDITATDDDTALVRDYIYNIDKIILDLNGCVLNRNVVGKDGQINTKSFRYDTDNNKCGAVLNIFNPMEIIDSNPNAEHEGFIGSDHLWHIGEGAGEKVIIKGGIITGGCGNGGAGGINKPYSVFRMTGGTICGNTGKNMEDGVSEGGGIYVRNNETTLINVNICYNTALSNIDGETHPMGAGIFQEGSVEGNLILNNCSIHNNYLIGSSGRGEGAGVYSGNSTSLTINGGSIYNNEGITEGSGSFNTSGGGIYIGTSYYPNRAVIKNCDIKNNKASGSAGIHAYGASSIEMENVEVSNNEITSSNNTDGVGGIYISDISEVTLKESTINNNSGICGGGILISGCDSAYMEDVEIKNNKAIGPEGEEENGCGAGLFLLETELEMFNVDIENNEASGYGAGVYIEYTDDPSTLTIGGKIVINDNKTNGNENSTNQSNVFLADIDSEYCQTKIIVSEDNPLSNESEIGITVKIDTPKNFGPGVDISKIFEGLDENNKDKFFMVNCSSENKYYNEKFDIEINGDDVVIPGEPEVFNDPDWNDLSKLMNGEQIKRSEKWEVKEEGNTRTIKLLSDFEAMVSNYPLQCTNPRMNIILDLNGHVLNRNVVASDGTIAWYDDYNGEDTIGHVINVKKGNLTIIDSNPNAEHVGFIGPDYLWHLGDGNGEKVVIKGGIITGGCGKCDYFYCAGGIVVTGGNLTIEGGTICGNTSNNTMSRSAYGGGLYIGSYYDGENETDSNVVINGGSICYNTALGHYVEQDRPIPDPKPIIDPVIIKSTLGSVVFNSEISEDTKNEPVVSESIMSDPDGAGIYQYGGSLTINDGSINNNVLLIGENCYGSGAGVYFEGKAFNMHGGTIKDNYASSLADTSYNAYGGGLYIMSEELSIIENAIITNNNATYGGGIYVYGDAWYPNPCEVTIKDSLISNNYAIKTSSNEEYPSGIGGGIYAYCSTKISLLGGKITNNEAEGYAGAVFVSDEIRRSYPWGGEDVKEGSILYVGDDLVVKNNIARNGIEEDNIYLENNGPIINISSEAPLTENAEIGITVNYVDTSDWQPGTNVSQFFNTLNDSNKDYFFMTNGGEANNGIVFGIVNNSNEYVLEGMKKVTCDNQIKGGTISTRSYYLEGKEVKVDVIPDDGYELEKLIYNNGVDVDITEERKFTMPGVDVTVTAIFKQTGLPKKTVTINVVENGIVETEKTNYTPGETVTVTVLPNKGYKLKSLIYNDGDDDHDITKEKSFTMPDADITITAVFEKASTPKPTPNPSHDSSYKIPTTGIK